MKKTGLAFHVHHDILIEYCSDYDERVRFIKENKPANEQELRLRLFQFIPHDKLPQEGLVAYEKAREAYYKAWDVCAKARETRDKAKEALDKTRETRDKARKAYHKKHRKELEELHSLLCSDCPWDGNTIFS